MKIGIIAHDMYPIREPFKGGSRLPVRYLTEIISRSSLSRD